MSAAASAAALANTTTAPDTDSDSGDDGSYSTTTAAAIKAANYPSAFSPDQELATKFALHLCFKLEHASLLVLQLGVKVSPTFPFLLAPLVLSTPLLGGRGVGVSELSCATEAPSPKPKPFRFNGAQRNATRSISKNQPPPWHFPREPCAW